ncbi:hypothetical protein ACVDG8_014585 [Mesorhizobium sp. ORM8.1]
MRALAVAVVALAIGPLAGCGGEVFKSQQSMAISDKIDGAVIRYYLPKAQLHFTASYAPAAGTGDKATPAALSIASATTAPEIVPDTTRPYYLSYSHAGLSDDTVDITWTSGTMLQKLSSESSDQTLKAVEAFNTLLGQVATTQKAVETLHAESSVAGGCPNSLSSTEVVNLSDGTQRWLDGTTYSKDKRSGCSLVLSAVVTRMGAPATFFASHNLDRQVGDPCAGRICFPMAQEVMVDVTAKVDGLEGLTAHKQIEFSVPSASARGYVAFSRRAFVDNKTSIQFANGLLSEFQSTDPSVVAGTITLATDVLKSVALTVPLAK